MDSSRSGFTRYFYEYLVYRAIEMAPLWRNRKLDGVAEPIAPLTASQGRAARGAIEQALNRRGLSLDNPRGVGVRAMMEATNEGLAEVVPDYQPVFVDPVAGANSRAYTAIMDRFKVMTGLGSYTPEGGARLPVSPYDPRWAHRQTVMEHGTELLSISDDAIRDSDLDFDRLDDPTAEPGRIDARWRLQLEFADVGDNGRINTAGPAYTWGDTMGMGRLATYMSAEEYRSVSGWLTAPARRGTSQVPLPEAGISADALDRSVAILDYLTDNGIDYTVRQGYREGQIVASLRGTGIQVRLTDTPGNEAYIGQVYDKGVTTAYLSNERETDPNSPNRYRAYTPTPAQAVDLLRFARGEQVERIDGSGVLGAPGEHRSRSGRGFTKDSYYAGGKRSATYITDAASGLSIHQKAGSAASSTTWIADREAGLKFLDDAVSSARERMESMLDVDGLMDEIEQFSGDPSEFVPSGTNNEIIDSVRAEYASMVALGHTRNGGSLLYYPGMGQDDVDAALVQGNTLSSIAVDLDDPNIDLMAEIKRHAQAVAESRVGTLEPGRDGLRFDPVLTAQLMTSEYGVWRNNDDIIAALRKVGDIGADELRGDDFYNATVADKLITFDAANSQNMLTHPDPMIARIGTVISDTVGSRGARLTSVRIDDNGVVEWTAERVVGAKGSRTKANATQRMVTGQIGQILPVGDYGEVVTKFAGSENHVAVPGWRAHVIPQRPGENKSLEERTRLRGYEQILTDAVRYQVSSNLLSVRNEVGGPTSVNHVLRSLYDTKHPVDFLERMRDEGLSESWRRAILETEASRVRYSNDLAKGSTMMAHHRANELGDGVDLRNDNTRDPLVVSGNRNMSVLDIEAGVGRFDPIMTGMAANQGIVRYLVQGASVDADGRIIPGDPDARVAVAAHPDAAAMGFDPHDRQNMSFSNIMHASSLAPGVRTAMTQCGGWTFEDGIVVSDQFAAEHPVRGEDGHMRALTVGDKLSDFHGNKGVISLVVDPYMDPTAAEHAGLGEEVALFRDNPGLDVVLSPFSAISRFNGGTAREMMTDPGDLTVRTSEGTRHIPGGTGPLNFIVTHMSVDAKTNVYDAEAMAAGKGRKASNQLAWALQSQGCDEVLADFYGGNDTGVAKVREYLSVLGMDMGPDGELSQLAHDGSDFADRQVFEMGDIRYDNSGRPVIKRMREDFGDVISSSGGVMELPFPLTLANGQETPVLSSSADGKPTSWGLPVLSSALRSEADLGDGTVSRHDHTIDYLRVFEASVRYRAAAEARAAVLADDSLSDAERAQRADGFEATMQSQITSAQTGYERISGDIISRRVEGKANMFKNQIMGHRVPNSATAVWTGDPRLDVDEVAMNSDMARELDPKGRGYVMVWRDPVLRDAGVRYMRVHINDELTGVAVNPVSVKSFDGDFDGDSVGLVGNLSDKAHREALGKLTVEANLLDLGVGQRDGDGVMRYPSSLHDSLDVKVAMTVDSERSDHLSELVDRAHESLPMLRSDAPEIVRDGLAQNRELVADMSDFYRDALSNRDNLVTLRFDSVDNHLRSVAKCFETGAKGSPGKLADYAEYLGARGSLEHGWIDIGAPKLADMADKYAGSQKATAFKTQYTGTAGARSQAAVQLLRSQGMITSACEAGYPATQSMLQAKHDPVDAAYRAEVLAGPVRDLWAGRKLGKSVVDGRYQWSPVVEEGCPVQATTAEWVQQFQDMYSSSQGMGIAVGIDHIENVAKALSDEAGFIRDTSRDNWSEWDERVRPLPLDRMAYGGSFAELCELAENRENMFDGPSDVFAPRTVRQNRLEIERAAQQLAAGDMSAAETLDLRTPTMKDVSAQPVRKAPMTPMVASRSQTTAARYNPGVGRAVLDDVDRMLADTSGGVDGDDYDMTR